MSSHSVDPCLFCLARHGCAFRRLPAETRRHLQALTRTRSYPRGALVARQGDAADGVYIVQSGFVRLVHVTPGGKMTVVKLLGPAGMVGLTETINAEPHLLSAETVDVSRLEYLPRQELLGFLARHPQAAFELLGWLARDFQRTLQECCKTMAKSPLATRLWHRLRHVGETCGLRTEEGVALSCHLTVQDLAHGLGCSRQWASKLLGELEDEGRIQRRAAAAAGSSPDLCPLSTT